MSLVTGYPNCRRFLHRRADSDELDVFEAARYYNDTDNNAPNNNAPRDTHEDRHHSNNVVYSGSSSNNNNNSLYVTPKSSHGGLEKHRQMKEILKKTRGDHPSSPGGRIASFLNSLFSQSASKKKKSLSSSSSSSSSSTSTAKSSSVKEEYDVDTWKRKRRSSISYFPSSSTRAATVDSSSRSLYSSSSSAGFRTPPASSKSYKELRSCYFDQKGRDASGARKKRSMDKVKSSSIININNNIRGSATTVAAETMEFRKFGDEDIGAESDSSSDLFELPNYDLGFELPVYETTHIDSIKRSIAAA